MKTACIWLPLLSVLLLICCGNTEGATPALANATSTSVAGVQIAEQQVRWNYPEQERWVEEPVFNGRLHLVEAGRQNSRTIILIHGLGPRGILDWAQVFPALTDRYHVIAIDLPGFGSSDNHQVQYAPEQYAKLVSWVVAQNAHGPVVVIGHSMGGAVSLRYAQTNPEQVSRLIMVDTAGILQRTVFIKHMAKIPVSYKWAEAYQSSIPGLNRLIRKIANKADSWTRSLLVIMDRMPDIPQLMMSSGLAQQYLYKDRSSMNAALGLVYENFSSAAREVETPTHIIWGEHDNVAPIRTGEVLANLMPNAQLHVISNAGHVPMTDNFVDFMDVLMHALVDAPVSRQAQKRWAVIEKEAVIQENARCDTQNNVLYTGHYRVIQLHNCHAVIFRNVVAESIEMVSSEASLENVKLSSPAIGLQVSNSVVIATLMQVDADVGMSVEASYLDLAGADFVTRNRLVDIRSKSQLYFSLSEWRQGGQQQALHGVSLGPVFGIQ